MHDLNKEEKKLKTSERISDMASFFGIHFIQGLLDETGWPRRKSFLSSKAIIDSLILDMTIGQLIDWAASIGACRPELALQIIATIYRDADWDNIGLFDIILPINDLRKRRNEKGNNNPREIVSPVMFSKYLKLTEASILNETKMQNTFEEYFFESLFWGLNNPTNYLNYFNTKQKIRNDRLPVYKKAGLGIDVIQTLEDYLNDGEKIIRLYEEKMHRHLSSIPKRLINDAHSLGITF
jgi:hypothetical protein